MIRKIEPVLDLNWNALSYICSLVLRKDLSDFGKQSCQMVTLADIQLGEDCDVLHSLRRREGSYFYEMKSRGE